MIYLQREQATQEIKTQATNKTQGKMLHLGIIQGNAN